MYQTGYLTIKDYNPEQFTYNLDYPNEEVKRGFVNSLSDAFTPSLADDKFSIFSFVDEVRAGDVVREENHQTRHQLFLRDPPRRWMEDGTVAGSHRNLL